jgi:hypothetical protein
MARLPAVAGVRGDRQFQGMCRRAVYLEEGEFVDALILGTRP